MSRWTLGCAAMAVAVAVGAAVVPASAARTPTPRQLAFRTPKGNVGCMLTWTVAGTVQRNGVVQCDVRPRPCTDPVHGSASHWRWTIQRRRPSARCAPDGDFLDVPGARVLRYGTGLTRGGITCISRRTGLRCADRRSKHGFVASRARQWTF